jgi:uncharacterized protein YbcI
LRFHTRGGLDISGPPFFCSRHLIVKTKGEIEAEISEKMVQFELDYMGRGPKDVRTHIMDDMVLVRFKGVLTQAERQLIKSPDGVELIKMDRRK